MQGKGGWGKAKSRSIAVFVANRLPSGPDKARYELGYSLFSNLTGARSGSLSGARYNCFGEAIVKVCKCKHTKCSTIPALQLQIRNSYGGQPRQSGLDVYPAVRMALLPGRVWIHLTSRIPPLHRVVNRRGTSGRQPQREWAACGVWHPEPQDADAQMALEQPGLPGLGELLQRPRQAGATQLAVRQHGPQRSSVFPRAKPITGIVRVRVSGASFRANRYLRS
jgi:hypothetical protein